MESAGDSLEQVAAEVNVCVKCPLHQERTKAVPGVGSPQAALMFIGEGPGFHEDRSGEPFVGAAGKFLDELLEGAGLKREEVFITNVVKCRPPGNRDPLPNEIAPCSTYLDRQIALINPRVIVTLGRFSMARWFPNEKISKIHGQAVEYDGRLVVPFFHPAAALHQPTYRPLLIEDFKKLPGLVAQGMQQRPDKPGASAKAGGGEPPAQLSLF